VYLFVLCASLYCVCICMDDVCGMRVPTDDIQAFFNDNTALLDPTFMDWWVGVVWRHAPPMHNLPTPIHTRAHSYIA
jgi:hypothetical protein